MAKTKRARSAKVLRNAASAARKRAAKLDQMAHRRAAVEAKKKKHTRCAPGGSKTAKKRITSAERAVRKAQARLKKARTLKRASCHSGKKRSKASVA
jgi:hypothetical protein